MTYSQTTHSPTTDSPIKTFEDFNLSTELKACINRLGFVVPTPIQSSAIPLALEGRDLLASAETGSGKTYAYLLPIIHHLSLDNSGNVLILVPTRELAIQVKESLKLLLGAKSFLNHAVLIGGEEMSRQLIQLQKKPKIIIGTPGRVCDHLNRKTLKLDNNKFLVLDETDRMLDLGFSDQLDYILSKLPASESRQTLMFSATMPANISKLSQRYLNNPERIQIGDINRPAPKIQQTVIQTVSNQMKFDTLVSMLRDQDDVGSSIVFVKTKRDAHDLSELLKDNGLNSGAMHGDLPQRKRDQVMKNLRNQVITIIVATDIAARGLDVPHIKYVFNYNLPECPEDYIHRIGRTGRAGSTGYAISFISREDSRKWQSISRLMKDKISITSTPANDSFVNNEEKTRSRDRDNFGSSSRESRPRNNFSQRGGSSRGSDFFGENRSGNRPGKFGEEKRGFKDFSGKKDGNFPRQRTGSNERSESSFAGNGKDQYRENRFSGEKNPFPSSGNSSKNSRFSSEKRNSNYEKPRNGNNSRPGSNDSGRDKRSFSDSVFKKKRKFFE